MLLREGHDVVVTVHRGGPEKERLDIHLPGKLQHRLRPCDVEMRTPHRILDRRPHAGLRGQMDNRINRLPVQHTPQETGIVDVLLEKVKVVLRKQVTNPLFFDGPVVVRVEVVDGIDNVAVIQEAAATMSADEAGGAGYEDAHGKRSVLWVCKQSIVAPVKNYAIGPASLERS